MSKSITFADPCIYIISVIYEGNREEHDLKCENKRAL
jgi:hypothetical protein